MVVIIVDVIVDNDGVVKVIMFILLKYEKFGATLGGSMMSR